MRSLQDTERRVLLFFLPFLFFRNFHRQIDGEFRPLSRCALAGNRALQEFDKSLDDGEAEACAIARHPFLLKRLEHHRQELLRHANAVIDDFDITPRALYHIIEEYYDIMQHARRDEIEKLIGDYAENKGLTDPELIEALGAVADIQVDKL